MSTKKISFNKKHVNKQKPAAKINKSKTSKGKINKSKTSKGKINKSKIKEIRMNKKYGLRTEELGLITKDMLLGEIMQKYPGLVSFISDRGITCVGCHVATWETVGQAAEMHGISADSLVNELNRALKEEEY